MRHDEGQTERAGFQRPRARPRRREDLHAGGSWSKGHRRARPSISRSTAGRSGKPPAWNQGRRQAAAYGGTGHRYNTVTAKDGIYRTADGAKKFIASGRSTSRRRSDERNAPSLRRRGNLPQHRQPLARHGRKVSGIKGDEVEAVVVAPSGVFCGTFNGVFFSADGGDTFVAFNDELMNTDVRALVIAGGSAHLDPMRGWRAGACSRSSCRRTRSV